MKYQLFAVLILFSAIVGAGLCDNEASAWQVFGCSVVTITVMQVAYVITSVILKIG